MNSVYDSPQLQRGTKSNLGKVTYGNTTISSSSNSSSTGTKSVSTKTVATAMVTVGSRKTSITSTTTGKTGKGAKICSGYDIDVFNDESIVPATPPRKHISDVKTASLNEKRNHSTGTTNTTTITTVTTTTTKKVLSLSSTQPVGNSTNTNYHSQALNNDSSVLSPHAFSFIGSTDDNDDERPVDPEERTVPIVSDNDDDDDDDTDEQDHYVPSLTNKIKSNTTRKGTGKKRSSIRDDNDEDEDDDNIYTASSKKIPVQSPSRSRSQSIQRHRSALSDIYTENLDHEDVDNDNTTAVHDDQDEDTVSVGSESTASSHGSDGFRRRRRRTTATKTTRRTKSANPTPSGSTRPTTRRRRHLSSSASLNPSLSMENFRMRYDDDFRSRRRFERAITILRDAELQYPKRTTFPVSVTLNILKIFRIPRSVINIIIERMGNKVSNTSNLTNESIKLLTQRENDREGYRRLLLIQQVLQSVHKRENASSSLSSISSSASVPSELPLTDAQRIAAQAITDARERFMKIVNSAVEPYDLERNGSPEQHARSIIERRLTFGKLQVRGKELTKQSFAIKLARAYEKLRNGQALNDEEEHTVWLAEQQEKRKRDKQFHRTVTDFENEEDLLRASDTKLNRKENFDIDWETGSTISLGDGGIGEDELARIMPLEKINEWKSDTTLGPLFKEAVAAADRMLTRKIETYVPCTLGAFIDLMQIACDTVSKQYIKGRNGVTKTNVPMDNDSLGSHSDTESDEDPHNHTVYPGNIRLGHIRHTIRPGEKIYGESALQELEKEMNQQSNRRQMLEEKAKQRTKNNQRSADVNEENIVDNDDDMVDNEDDDQELADTPETIKQNIKLFEYTYEQATQPLLTPFGYWLKYRSRPDHYLPADQRPSAMTSIAISRRTEYTPASFAALPKDERTSLWNAFYRQVPVLEKQEIRNTSVYEFIYHVRSLTTQMGSIEKNRNDSHTASSTFVAPPSGRSISARDMQLKHGTLLPKLKAYHAAEYKFQTYLPVPSLAVAEYYNRQIRLQSEQIMEKVQDYGVRQQQIQQQQQQQGSRSTTEHGNDDNEDILSAKKRKLEDGTEKNDDTPTASLSPLRINYREQTVPVDHDDLLSMVSELSDNDGDENNHHASTLIPSSPSPKETIHHYRRRIWNQTRSYFHHESQLIKAIRNVIPGFRTRLRIGSYNINGSVLTNGRRIIVADIISPNIRFLWTPSPRAGDLTRTLSSSSANTVSASSASSSSSSSSSRFKLLTRLSPNFNPMAPFSSPEALYTLPGTVTIQYMIRVRSISELEYAYYEGILPRPPELYRHAGVKFIKSHASVPQDTSFFTFLPLPSMEEDDMNDTFGTNGTVTSSAKGPSKRRRKYNKRFLSMFGDENPLTNDVDSEYNTSNTTLANLLKNVGTTKNNGTTKGKKGTNSKASRTDGTTALATLIAQSNLSTMNNNASSVSISNSNASSSMKLSVLQSPTTPYRSGINNVSSGKSAADIANSIASGSRGRYTTLHHTSTGNGSKITPPRPLNFNDSSPSSVTDKNGSNNNDHHNVSSTTLTGTNGGSSTEPRSIRGKLNFDNTEIDLTTIADMKAVTRRDYGTKSTKESLTLSKLTTGTAIVTDTTVTPGRNGTNNGTTKSGSSGSGSSKRTVTINTNPLVTPERKTNPITTGTVTSTSGGKVKG